MKTAGYVNQVKKALRVAGRPSVGLEPQILALAGALRTLEVAHSDIDGLDTTVVKLTTSQGEKIQPHPAFRVQKDALAAVTVNMKALGLTAADLTLGDNEDPLVALTRGVLAAGEGDNDD